MYSHGFLGQNLGPMPPKEQMMTRAEQLQYLNKQIARVRDAIVIAERDFGKDSIQREVQRKTLLALTAKRQKLYDNMSAEEKAAAQPGWIERLATSVTGTVTDTSKNLLLYGGLALAAYVVLPALLTSRRQ